MNHTVILSRGEKRYAVVACLVIVLALGFAGWYENYVPVIPSPSVAQMLQACDREAVLPSAPLRDR